MPALTYFIYLFICLFFDNSIHEFILATPTSYYPLSPHSHLPACFYFEIEAHKVASPGLELTLQPNQALELERPSSTFQGIRVSRPALLSSTPMPFLS